MKTKMQFTIGLAALLLAGVLTGCANVNDNVPHTTIRGKIAGQPFSIENPKDTILDGLEVSASANGTASIHIDHLATVMKAENISATGDAGEKLVNAGANAFERGVNAAGNAGGKLIGQGAHTAVTGQ